MKRLCLFAGYSNSGTVEDYVIYYIKSLAEFSDVYYMSDSVMNTGELHKISSYTKGAYAQRHEKYDFGSWQELINIIGWDKVETYDEVILCNDSCFGPFFQLMPIFEKAAADYECDFWGLTEGGMSQNHIQSYFMVFKANVIRSTAFKNFMDSVQKGDKADMVWKYEITFTGVLENANFKAKKYFTFREGPYFHWKSLIQKGFPFMKVRVLVEKSDYKFVETLTGWDDFLTANCMYDVPMITSYYKKLGVDLAYFNTISYKVSDLWRKIKIWRQWVIKVKITKKRKAIRLLGIDFINIQPPAMASILSGKEK